MNPSIRLLVLAACSSALVWAGGCFKGLENLEPFPCAQTETCPSGFHCVEGLCQAGDPGDAGGLKGDTGLKVDSGALSEDSGAPSADTGPLSEDTGAPGPDTGAPSPDTGVAPDTGVPSADTGVAPGEDAGAIALSFEWAQWPVPPDAPNNYTVSDAGIVTDNVTGLIWQQVPAAKSDFNAESAKSHCRNLVLGGVSGWTLPTRIELLTIVDATKSSPAINSSVFPGTVADYYWSSSPTYDHAGWAWRVSFDDGSAETADGADPGSARCVVRKPAASGPRYTVLGNPGDQTITDNLTHLIWLPTLPARSYKQADAITFCEGQSLPSKPNNWRLPTKLELESLVDPTLVSNAALDQTVFIDAGGQSRNRQTYRSSTVATTDPTASGWVVEFDSGSSSIDTFDDDVWVTVRCVHDP